MLNWLGSYAVSSIGKKVTMALSGLALVGFLVTHLSGNLLLYKGDDGRAFELYAQKLHDLGPLLLVAEFGLIALFGAHIFLAARTTLENRRARTSRYAVATNHGERTFASSSMPITGLVILLFLIVHLINFRFDSAFKDKFAHGEGAVEGVGSANMVWSQLAGPVEALLYLVGVIALTIHLVHAIPSALQTLGVSHPHLNPWLRKLGIGLALLLGLGFASLPVAALVR